MCQNVGHVPKGETAIGGADTGLGAASSFSSIRCPIYSLARENDCIYSDIDPGVIAVN